MSPGSQYRHVEVCLQGHQSEIDPDHYVSHSVLGHGGCYGVHHLAGSDDEFEDNDQESLLGHELHLTAVVGKEGRQGSYYGLNPHLVVVEGNKLLVDSSQDHE